MRIQIWSYNYDPEPMGIAPLSGVVARVLAARGHDVSVVAAHPHYPEPQWGSKLLPYREDREGIPVLRLPLWVGRHTAAARMRQEATFAASLSAASLTLRTPDVILAVSPSFPALLPTMVHARLRNVPWVLWLQDILPDGAAVTGILEDGAVVRAARRLERAAYRSASQVVVISESFRENLRRKGVPDEHMTTVFNPASRPVRTAPRPADGIDPATVLTMGNVGFTQNLAAVVRAFEDSEPLRELGARLVIAGDGVAGDEVRAAVRTDRVTVTGVLGGEALERELLRARVALVSQRYDDIDFNVPSKLMNFMGYGLATVAAVRPDSEVSRIVNRAGAGWTVESPEDAAATLAEVLRDPAALEERGANALRFAHEQFVPDTVGERIEAVLARVCEDRGARGRTVSART
jgi:colanic acid biosynthesis glycosyl transferase WcaI